MIDSIIIWSSLYIICQGTGNTPSYRPLTAIVCTQSRNLLPCTASLGNNVRYCASTQQSVVWVAEDMQQRCGACPRILRRYEEISGTIAYPVPTILARFFVLDNIRRITMDPGEIRNTYFIHILYIYNHRQYQELKNGNKQ